MNLSVLLEYLSKELHTIIRCFSPSFEFISTINERPQFVDYIEDCIIFEEILTIPSTYEMKVTTFEKNIAYATVSNEQTLFLIGPVVFSCHTKCNHHIPDYPCPDAWISNVYHCELSEFLKFNLLLHNLFHPTKLTLSKATLQNCIGVASLLEIQKTYSEILFERGELNGKHNPYDQELREFGSIEHGDVDALERSWGEDYIGTLGTLAKTPLRNAKNLGIVLVTLASRAAIRGGMHPELSFSLSDSYINKIEELSSPEAAYQLGRESEFQYACMVRDIKLASQKPKSNRSPDSQVSKCKDYIFTHLHGKITVSEVATALYLNANYLSELFKKQEGITISTFILKEKIKLVKNLLVYSQYSYIEITSYLGFSSQSHLGHQFKKETGYTLRQYRETYGVKDFVEQN